MNSCVTLAIWEMTFPVLYASAFLRNIPSVPNRQIETVEVLT